MMSLWDALRMNMMISYQELVRTFPRLNDVKILVVLKSSCESEIIHVLSFMIVGDINKMRCKRR